MLAETPVVQHIPCYSAVSSSLMNHLPDHSNYSPFCHTYYFTPNQYYSSLFGLDRLPSRSAGHKYFTSAALYCRIKSGNSGETQCLEEAEKQPEASVDVLFPPFQIVTHFPFVSLLSISILSLLPFSILPLLPLHFLF